MMMWIWLLLAIASEVGGTVALRVAAHGKAPMYALVAVGYALSYVFLLLSLKGGMPLGGSYGIWTAVGVAATAIIDTAVFGEKMTKETVAGLLVIVVGVALVETAANPS